MTTTALTAEATSKFIQAGDLRLHYHDSGSGEVVVCIHGGGPGAAGWSNYQRNIAGLSKHFRVLVVDLPGYGQSDKPVVTGSRIGFYAHAIRDMLDALHISKASFIGNSLGGGTTLRVAMDYPEYTDKLVLMGAIGGLPFLAPQPTEGTRLLVNYYEAPGPSREKMKAYLHTLVYDTSWITNEVIEERYLASTQPDILANPPVRPGRPPLEDMLLWQKLASVKNKVLVVWGRDDRIMTLDNALIMLNQFPDVRLHVFAQCGHWVQWEKSEEFNQLVTDFLLSPPSAR